MLVSDSFIILFFDFKIIFLFLIISYLFLLFIFVKIEIIGKIDPFVEFKYFQSDTCYWNYETAPNDNAGSSSEWAINQTINLHLTPTNNNNNNNNVNDIIKIRVKDKNNLKSDKLIGKGIISCEKLTNTTWSQYNIQLLDKKDQNSGNMTINYRFNHYIPPNPVHTRLQRLHFKIHNFRPTAIDIIPLFVLQLESANLLNKNKNQLNQIYSKYGVKCRDWCDENLQNETKTSTSNASIIVENQQMNQNKKDSNYHSGENLFLFYLFNEKKTNDNFITLQSNYKFVLDLINEVTANK